jgi:hypothetical protein
MLADNSCVTNSALTLTIKRAEPRYLTLLIHSKRFAAFGELGAVALPRSAFVIDRPKHAAFSFASARRLLLGCPFGDAKI